MAAANVTNLRDYAEELRRTAASYRTAAACPGLRGGWDGQAGSYLRSEADRLESESRTVDSVADGWEARA
jgi:hypothetical protein